MTGILKVGNRIIPCEELVPLLAGYQLLLQLLRELVTDQAIAEIGCTARAKPVAKVAVVIKVRRLNFLIMLILSQKYLGNKICDESNAFCRDPIGRTQRGYEVTKRAINWFKNYRLSLEEQRDVDPETIDCNDNAACELLSEYGFPMHIISIYPKNN